MISVLTVTNRYGGIDIAYASLLKQTHKDFEWVIVDGLYEARRDVLPTFVKNIQFVHLPEPKQEEDTVWCLNKAYNEGLRHCSGDYVLSYQDYIWLPGNGLEKMALLADDKTIVSGVGHKARHPEKATNPKGLISIFPTPFSGRPSGVSELDTRIDGRPDVVESNYSFFELNYSIAPKEMYFEVGGFEEALDKGYGCDNLAVALKVHLLDKYTFFIDKSNECIGFNQQSLFPRPADWERRHNNKGRYHEWSSRVLGGGEYRRYIR